MTLSVWKAAPILTDGTRRWVGAALFAPLMGLSNFSQGLADEPSAVELDYKIFLGGLHAMSLTTRLSLNRDAGYRMAVDAATDGFIGSLVDARYRAESEGVTQDDVVEELLRITPTKEDELTNDARFQKIFAS